MDTGSLDHGSNVCRMSPGSLLYFSDEVKVVVAGFGVLGVGFGFLRLT